MSSTKTSEPMKGSYALFRLPYGNEYTEMVQLDGEPERLGNVTELSGKSGFVVAPFEVTAGQPVLLIHPDTVRTRAMEDLPEVGGCSSEDGKAVVHGNDRMYYSIDFANCHSRLLAGEFSKIVLARCSVEQTADGKPVTPRDLFLRACRLYPRLFVALVSTPVSGTWLVATPEVLLDGDGDTFRTMALAGTMKLEGRQLEFDNPPSRQKTVGMPVDMMWNHKNICEQTFVSSYITQCIERFTNDFTVDGPFTARAGDVVHLRTDFTFRWQKGRCRMGEFLSVMHPTPAVCGLPKRETFDFIIKNEKTPRRYYSGFMGPLNQDGATHLFVSLRCMEIVGSTYRLYAGGGLLADSEEEQEWNETEDKMNTMRNVLRG